MTTIHPASITPQPTSAVWSGPRVVHTAVARPVAGDLAVAPPIEWLPRSRPDRRL